MGGGVCSQVCFGDRVAMTDRKIIVVTEGVSGVWHYHLSHTETRTRGLCGAQTMATSIKLSAWGSISQHLPESWCGACAKQATALGIPVRVVPRGLG